MTLSFLLPAIHERPTGGNIYNRRIIAEISDWASITAHAWSPSGDSGPPLSPSPETVVVVDSLLLGDPTSLRALRRTHNDGPLVLMSHYLHCIDPNEHDNSRANAERALLSLFDAIVTTSHSAKRALVEEGVPASDVAVIPPGLDTTYRSPLSASPNGSPVLLTVANVVPGKGLPALARQLDALADLDWRWHLVGDDTLAPHATARLRRALQSVSIADRVTGPTRVPPNKMRTEYDRADLFVLPSRFETCSMATREALARGCPVVGYDVGGMPENLGDAPAGRLVSPDAPDTLADILRTLLVDPDTRAAMQAAARQRSHAFPTWAEAAAHFFSTLRSMLPTGR